MDAATIKTFSTDIWTLSEVSWRTTGVSFLGKGRPGLQPPVL